MKFNTAKRKIKIKEREEVLTWVCDLTLENKNYTEFWDNLEIVMMITEELYHIL